MMSHPSLAPLGFGLGLRARHLPHIFEHRPAVDWFEIISENYMDTDGKPRRNLARIRESYPIVMHGVALSIGTVDPLNSEYLRKLKALVDWAEPEWISDHLCWTGIAHRTTHDLLPVPYTEEALQHIVRRIGQVQDYLQRPIALENPSTYLEFNHSEMSEAEFISRMVKASGCNLLLDVNNVYVTCYNHRLDAQAYLDALPLDSVIQVHLSGHTNKGTHIIDTHDDHVVDEVWNLYKYVVQRAGRIPNTMIEWDDNIPEFPVLYAEMQKARAMAVDARHYELPDLAREQVPQRANHDTPLPMAQLQLQQAILRGKKFDSQPQAWIRGKQDFSSQAQLDVYVNAYRYRLRDVVAEDYPVLKHYLGEKVFTALIRDFVEQETPQHFNIARYAATLPEFVERTRPQDSFAQELCRMETAMAQLADAEETAPLVPQHLHGMTPQRLMQCKLYPRAALQLFAFTHPVNEYYRAVMAEESPAIPMAENSFVAVFRNDDVVWRMDLEAQEYALLTALFADHTLGEALVGLSASDAASEKLSEWCSRWMRNGLLAAHDYKTETVERKHHAVA